jgi:hypothetical protein
MPITQRALARVGALAPALLVTLFCGLAFANGEPRGRLVLELSGVENCISQSELEQNVEVELGHEVFVRDETPPKTTVRVVIAPGAAPARYRATVGVAGEATDTIGESASSTRELTSDTDCRALDEQLTLVVALLIDDELKQPDREVAPEPPIPPEPKAEPPPKDEIQPLEPVSAAPGWEAAQRDTPWRFEGDLSAATGFGLLPNVGFGAELGFLAEPPGLPTFRLHVIALGSSPVEPVPDASVSFFYAAGGLALCPTLVAFEQGRLRSCVGVDFAAIRAESHGLEESRVALQYLAQVGLGLRGTLELGGGWLGTLGIGAAIPTKIDRFVYRQDGTKQEIFEMALVPIVATLGVSRDFR